MAEKKTKLNPPDYIFIVSFSILIILGLIVLSSASYFAACQKLNDCYFYLKHQILFGLIPGLIFFIFFYFLNYKVLKKIAFPLLVISIILLILVFIPSIGFGTGETKRWISLGGFSFQPAEIAKLTFLIYIAAWFSKFKEQIKSFKKVFIPFVILLSVISLLIILQPDIGTAATLIASAVMVYFIAGAKWSHIGVLSAGLLGFLVLLIKIAPYRLARITAFLNPEIDPQGIGYHIQQAFLAISSGGIFGRGLGHSHQKIQFLPEVISDSIFAVMAEEFGFIAMVLVVCLYFYLAISIFRLTAKSVDDFGKLLAAGIGFWFIFQTVINMGAMLGIVPLTGIPLPFIGYGGSNLVIFLAAFGIVVNISRQIQSST